ncbi:MAG: tRNA (adenosine(37)-N6)-threonylcarbamoyltransferase complex dimerization subunit type 1 TsaB [Solirubrobacteraceae bacterium]
MIVLGFDTATPATVVGLRLADGTTLQARDDPAAGERPGHTARLLGLASELLAQAGVRWEELQRIAVGVGPGTFTGLRIGVASARGLAQSLGVEVVGVSTLRVLAEAALGMRPPAHDLSPPARVLSPPAPDPSPPAHVLSPPAHVLAAIDARRGEVFAAAYAAAGELAAPRALAPEELAGIPARAGGADRDWLAVGDGALRFRGYLEAIAIAVPAEDSPLHRVDAGVLCELAMSAPAGALDAVLPDYRRRPDAEIALKGGAAGRRLANQPPLHCKSEAGEPGSSFSIGTQGREVK